MVADLDRWSSTQVRLYIKIHWRRTAEIMQKNMNLVFKSLAKYFEKIVQNFSAYSWSNMSSKVKFLCNIALKECKLFLIFLMIMSLCMSHWKGPYSIGKRRGLAFWAMVLGREYDSRVYLKSKWKRQNGPLDFRKNYEIDKSTQKIFEKNRHNNWQV